MQRIRGVGRVADNEKALIVYFDEVPSDDDMRELHHCGLASGGFVTNQETGLIGERAGESIIPAHRHEDNAAHLRNYWNAFCTCDFAGETDNFVERMEEAGFIELVPVTRKIMNQEAFASELGIEMGGNCWQLTAKGREAMDAA